MNDTTYCSPPHSTSLHPCSMMWFSLTFLLVVLVHPLHPPLVIVPQRLHRLSLSSHLLVLVGPLTQKNEIFVEQHYRDIFVRVATKSVAKYTYIMYYLSMYLLAWAFRRV